MSRSTSFLHLHLISKHHITQCIRHDALSYADKNPSSTHTAPLSHDRRIHRLDRARPYTPSPCFDTLYYSPPTPHRAQCLTPPLLEIPPILILYSSYSILYTSTASLDRLHLPHHIQLHHLANRPPLLHLLLPSSRPIPLPHLHHFTLYPLSPTPHHRIPARSPRTWNPDFVFFFYLPFLKYDTIHTYRKDPGYLYK